VAILLKLPLTIICRDNTTKIKTNEIIFRRYDEKNPGKQQETYPMGTLDES
jgi:hypothetical protein